MSRDRARVLDLLLVEDSRTDVELTEEALAAAEIETELHVASDGEAALAFLRRKAPHQSAPRPDLVLLDLNMPRKDGREVLREMKQDEHLCSIPVLVLTTSGAQEDVAEAYASGANAYIRKPVRFDDFVAAMRAIDAFWMSVAMLPDAGSDASWRNG